MILRLRRRAGAVLLGLGAFVSLTAAAQLPVYVTRDDMQAYVWTVLASVAVGTVLVGAGLLAWIMQRDRSLQQASIDLVIAATERLAVQIESAVGALAAHNADPLSHRAASEHNHGPMMEQTSRIEEKLDSLILEHRVIRGQEDEVCSALKALRTQAKRATDPADVDVERLRGRG